MAYKIRLLGKTGAFHIQMPLFSNSPVLFVIFVNDLTDVVTSTVKIFADDTKRPWAICFVTISINGKI